MTFFNTHHVTPVFDVPVLGMYVHPNNGLVSYRVVVHKEMYWGGVTMLEYLTPEDCQKKDRRSLPKPNFFAYLPPDHEVEEIDPNSVKLVFHDDVTTPFQPSLHTAPGTG